jgi:hypothetical protein
MTSRREARARAVEPKRVEPIPWGRYLGNRERISRACWKCHQDLTGVAGPAGHQLQLCDRCRQDQQGREAAALG